MNYFISMQKILKVNFVKDIVPKSLYICDCKMLNEESFNELVDGLVYFKIKISIYMSQ